MHKKIFVLILMFVALNIFAQETTVVKAENPNTKKSKLSFSFDFGMNASFNIAKNDDKLAFDSFCFDVTDLTFGTKIKLTDKLAFNFYFTTPMILETTAEDLSNTITIAEIYPELGVGLIFNPTKKITLEFGLGHNLTFSPSDSEVFSIDTGLFISAGFSYKNSYFAISIYDTVSPNQRITKIENYKSFIENETEVELTFDFFNFIKKDLNSGLWISDYLAVDYYFDNDNKYSNCTFDNEFFVGLHTAAIKWFEAKAAFYGDFAIESDKNGKIVDGSNTVKLGLFFKVAFSCKNIGFAISYNPVFYTVNAENPEDVNHEVQTAISISF